MSLCHDDYYDVIRKTQLVSTDIYFFYKKSLFLGKRTNEPAKGWLFTPGCRAYKNETLSQTCTRLAKEELGLTILPSKCMFIGVYDHLYSNNFRDEKFGTHYVNIAYTYELSDEEKKQIKIDKQHSSVEWVPISKVLSDPRIHNLVKKTFVHIDNKFV